MFRSDPRYAETLRDRGWRRAMETAGGWDIRTELRKLRAARSRDALLIHHHDVDN